MNKPKIGSPVHYVLPEQVVNAGKHRPAIILDQNDSVPGNDFVRLLVFINGWADCTNYSCGPMPTGNSTIIDCSYDESGKPGTWHWPE